MKMWTVVFCTFATALVASAGNHAGRRGVAVDPGPGKALEEEQWRSRIPENESDYVVSLAPDGETYYARDGRYGNVVYEHTDAGRVIQTAIDSLDVDAGGRVFIKAGTYELERRVDIEDRSHVEIVGTEGSILTAPDLGAVVYISGADHITFRKLSFVDCGGKGINCVTGDYIRIEDCTFDNLVDSAIQARIFSSEDPLKGMWIQGCHVRAANQDSTTATGRGAIYLYCIDGLFIQDNLVEGCGNIGISVQRCTDRAVITDNVVRDNDSETIHGAGHGIYVGSNSPQSADVTIRGNVITGNGGNGIEAGSGTGDPGSRYVITDNICDANGMEEAPHYRSGIYITGSHHVVANNVCTRNGGDGIKVGYAYMARRTLVVDNVISDNNAGGDTTPQFSSGIACMGSGGEEVTPQSVVIRGNLITNDTGTQIHAVYCVDESDGILIEGNHVLGHEVPQISWDPASSEMVVRGNLGFATACRGSALDSTGGVTGSIDVDLASELEIDDVISSLDPLAFSVTPTSGDSQGFFNHWVEPLGGTTFRIHWASGLEQSEVSFVYAYDDD